MHQNLRFWGTIGLPTSAKTVINPAFGVIICKIALTLWGG